MSESIPVRGEDAYNPNIVTFMQAEAGGLLPVVLLREVRSHFEQEGASDTTAIHTVYDVYQNLENFGWRSKFDRRRIDPNTSIGLRADSLAVLVEGIQDGTLSLPTIDQNGAEIQCLRSLVVLVQQPPS